MKNKKIVPTAISKADQSNFNTLCKALYNRDLAAVSAIRKSDGKQVTLVCAMQRNADETITPMPLAVMIEGNPFEDFEDPTIPTI